jgi:hypothetical protein
MVNRRREEQDRYYQHYLLPILLPLILILDEKEKQRRINNDVSKRTNYMAVDFSKRSFVSVDNDEGKCGVNDDIDDTVINSDNNNNDDTYNYENKILSESSTKVSFSLSS